MSLSAAFPNLSVVGSSSSSEILVNIYKIVQDVNPEYENFNSHFGIEFFLRGKCCSDT
jgi:hypothetical protein